MSALVAYPVLSAFKKRVDHRRYNGAALLGLRGLVFRASSADELAFGFALERAYDAAARNPVLGASSGRIAHGASAELPALPQAAAAPSAATDSWHLRPHHRHRQRTAA